MKRVILAAAFCAAFFAMGHSRAQAIVEFCPARLHLQAVQPANAKPDTPADLYGFDLSAAGPRSVSASLAFDTSAGWFDLAVPRTAIAEKDRRYTSISAEFTRRDYVSPVMYVRFPQALTIEHAWVYAAKSSGDHVFGWDAKGQVACDPPAGTNPAMAGDHPSRGPQLDPRDRDDLNAPPSAGSQVLPAMKSGPLASAACSDPFAYATAIHAVTPQYPEALKSAGGAFESSVEVAVDGTGALEDAWIWGPSGNTYADDAALAAARASKYKAGQAYCRAVPGLYIFRVTFMPGRPN